MAYTRVNGMRSTRYPLQGQAGLGCGCHAPSPVTTALRGLGLDIESAAVGGGVTLSAVVGTVIGVGIGYWYRGSQMRANRRRR